MPRLFTVEKANALLPALRDGLARLAEAHEHMVEAAHALEGLERQRDRFNALQLARPLREARERLGQAIAMRRDALEQFAAWGVQVKSVEPALLDFPAWRDGRVVLLCWRDGESSVAHWHDLDGGFVSRQPL